MKTRANHHALVRVIDDDPELCEAQKYFFQFEGIPCSFYLNPIEFLEKDDLERPGCVILDIEMPRMKGPELQAEMIKRNIDLPIIFLSAHGSIPLALECVKKGAFGFLEKPLDPETQLQLVKKAIEKNSADREQLQYVTDQKALYETLTPAEKMVALYVSKGYRNKEISELLNIGEATVKTHRLSAFRKLGVDNPIELHEFFELLAKYKQL